MSFPRYPKYKASGVEWLGDVPEHWDTRRLGFYFRERRQKVSDTDFEPLSVTMQGIVPRIDTAAKSDDGENRKQVCVGDFVINSRSDRKGSAGVSTLSGSVSLISTVLEPQDAVVGEFIHHLLRSVDFQEEYYRYGKGIVADLWSTNFSEMRNIRLAIPPVTEQTKIASFLDRETSKIDGLVGEQRRLMELLKEKRQAVISHAVTKGLNPHAPLKPSDIEWLGDVPEHWRVGKLGYACKLRGGFAFSAADFGADGVVVVRMNNLKRGQLDLTEAARIPESCCNEAVALAAGDLVWGMSGSTGETGSLGNYARVRAEDLPCQLNQRVGRFVVAKSLLNLDFFENVIQTAYFYEQVMLLVTGTAQFNVSSEQVQSCLIALPTIDEQRAIADFLDRETAAMDALTAEAERGIELLQERRTALISAAVTGQIDVRGLAATEAA